MSDTTRDALLKARAALEVATTPLAKDRQEVLRARAAIDAALKQPSQKDRAIQIVEWHRTGYNDQQIDPIVNALREEMK